MPIHFACPACFRAYSAPDDVAGRSISCAGCAHPVVIPPQLPDLPVPPDVPRPPREVQWKPDAPGPPREVVWEPEVESRPHKRRPRQDVPDDDDDEWERRRHQRNEWAKQKALIKLALIGACLVGIVLAIRFGQSHIDDVREAEKALKQDAEKRAKQKAR